MQSVHFWGEKNPKTELRLTELKNQNLNGKSAHSQIMNLKSVPFSVVRQTLKPVEYFMGRLP